MTASSFSAQISTVQNAGAFALHITEVTVEGGPEKGYEYRGQLRSLDETGKVRLKQELQARRKPEWLVNARHRGSGALEFSLLCRRYDTRAWQEVGQATLRPQEHLNDESSVLVETAIIGWKEAPECRLRIRLSQSEEARERSASAAGISKVSRATVARETAPVAEELALSAAELEAIPPLTSPEIVIVKDIWNKLLAFQDLLIEMFFERLLHEAPELIESFGDAIDNAPRYFAEMFDVAVRGLNPHTERCLREGYRGVYPAPLDGYKTVEEYAQILADLGMRPKHWMIARRIWAWTLPHIPYLEEYDRETLSRGVHSAPYRFFNRHILPPALNAIRQFDIALPPEMVRGMVRNAEFLLKDARSVGMEFYRTLFEMHPDVLPYFGRSDMDALSEHLIQAIAFLARSLEAGQSAMQETLNLARVHAHVGVPPEAYPKIVAPLFKVMRRRLPDFTPELEHAWATFLNRVVNTLIQPMLNQSRLLAQAREFLELVAREQEWEAADYERRWLEIEREVHATGAYTHTYEELAYGAQVAWRNAAKCIARIAWRNMIVRDLRHVTDPDAMFRECVEHVRMGTNGGNLQIVMNVFRAKKPGERWGPRIWNSQYLRFAAYEQPDGTIVGDPANLGLTRALLRQGWTPPATRTAFDVLPLAIETPGYAPKLYEFPEEVVRKVSLEHPTIPQFAELNLKWCTIPAISNFRMEIGGINYGCVPFNGWFMGTEIARNLWEPERYDQAEAIARALGLDTSSEQTLWRDRAFLELNVAVLHSFAKAKISLVDHQTASRQFLSHDLREKKAGRECPAQWSWVVPPAGGSSTAVWHHEMRDFYLSPHYHYAADKWAVVDSELSLEDENESGAEEASANRIVILYGSETGTAEGFARQAARRLARFHPRVLALDEIVGEDLRREQLALIIASTFADGEMPGNAKKFYAWIQEQPGGALDGLNFSVMALGSTVYPHFCAAGVELDRQLARVGASRALALCRGDEIRGQVETFRQWLEMVARILGEDPTSGEGNESDIQLRVSFVDEEQTATIPVVRRLPGTLVPVVANRELLKEVVQDSRSTRFIAFDIAGTDMTYETGDHVAIYPHNPRPLVERLCARLRVDPDAWFVTSLTDSRGAAVEGDTPYPHPTRVRQALTEDFDLSLREPFEEMIAILLQTAQNDRDKATLKAWSDTLDLGEQNEACRDLKKHISANFITLADLLEAFLSAAPRLEQLLELLPKQKPRLYSISSCSLLHPQQIHVTVGVVQVTTEAGRTRQGLCSNYLAGLHPEQGATARIAVLVSNFRPPQDVSAPILLVGPGTGLSPLIGFLQHREMQIQQTHRARAGDERDRAMIGNGVGESAGNNKVGENPGVIIGHSRLYFGCRNHSDYLYQQELETWRDAGVLTHLGVAFSRLGEQKMYVQHLIGQHAGDVWQVLSQPNCHYYVCGDAKMADDVFEALMTIARTQGGLSHAEAVEFFQQMQAENRYVMDVWGVLLNFPKALADVQEARYTQGERWLKRISANAVA